MTSLRVSLCGFAAVASGCISSAWIAAVAAATSLSVSELLELTMPVGVMSPGMRGGAYGATLPGAIGMEAERPRPDGGRGCW